MTEKSHSEDMELLMLWGFIKDYWQLIKKHYHADLSDAAACEAVINDTNDLADKYQHELCRSLIMTFLWYKDEHYFDNGGILQLVNRERTKK